MVYGPKAESVVECVDLSKRYGEHYVFKNTSFTIGHGVTGLVAPNGYGKTTFIEMCAGVRKNYSGQIKILGGTPDSVKSSTGLVADMPAFPENIKVGEYIRLVSDIYGKKPDEKLIHWANIKEVFDLRIGDLSAGYVKRLAFLLAVIHSPKVVFADEPFSNVDKMAVGVMQEMIKELRNSGVAFIISSHDLNELVDVADKILIIGENSFREVNRGRPGQRVLEISSENDGELYDLLKTDFEVNRTSEGLLVAYGDLKQLMKKLTTFEKEIFSLKSVDEKERFLNEIDEAIARD